MNYDSLPRASFVAVYLFRRTLDGDPEYLLLRRAPDQGLPGIWQGTTGTIEDGEAAWETAFREVQEETGIVVTELCRVDRVETYYHTRTDRIHYGAVFVGEVAADAEVTLSAEHDAAEWHSLGGARAELHWPNQRETLAYIHTYYALTPPPPESVIKK